MVAIGIIGVFAGVTSAVDLELLTEELVILVIGVEPDVRFAMPIAPDPVDIAIGIIAPRDIICAARIGACGQAAKIIIGVGDALGG